MSDEFVKGSVIVCQDCWRPVWVLERGLGALDRGGRSASAFRPLRQKDLDGILTVRPDVPFAWQLLVAEWLHSEQAKRTLQASPPKAGEPALCPNCGGCWARFEAREDGSSEHDRGYVIQLLDIPPLPAVKGQLDRVRWTPTDDEAWDLTVDELPRTLH